MDRRKTDRRRAQPFDQYVLDLQLIVKQLWRRRLLVAVLVAAPTLLGVIYALSRPDIYQPVAAVVLEDQGVTLADVAEAVPGMAIDTMTVETQAKVLASSSLIHEVIARLGLHVNAKGVLATGEASVAAAQAGQESGQETQDETGEETEKVEAALPENGAEETPVIRSDAHAALLRYARALGVNSTRSSRVIEVSFAHPDPYLATEIVNAHIDQYVESQIRQKREQAARLNEWIAHQVGILRTQSMEKARAVQIFREENRIVTGRNSEELIYQQISDIAAELVPIESRKLDLQARHDAVRSGRGANAVSSIQDSGVIQSLKTQAAAARQELRGLSAKYGANHPLRVEAQSRVDQIESEIAREMAAIRTTVKNELDTVTQQEEMLLERLTTLKAEADGLREKQIQLHSLEQDAEASRKLLESFISRYEEITSQIEFTRPDVRILSKADVPVLPVGSKRALIVAAAFILSCVFAVCVVLLIGVFERGINTAEELRKHLNFRLMAALPAVRQPLSEISGAKRSAYREEIKRIYLHLNARSPIGTVLVTAASPGEGKSSMIMALAAYLNSVGRKVVVVDADIRSADIADIAHVDDAPGLADLLSGRADLAAVIRRDERGISILPAGRDVAGTLDIAGAHSLRGVVETLKASYDVILIDSAPILDSSDAETIAGFADQVVMVVSRGVTGKEDLKKAAETLRQFVTTVPWTVLNRADSKTS